MLHRDNQFALKAAFHSVTTVLLFSASAFVASASDAPTANVAAADGGLVISGNTVSMAPIPDKAPSRHARTFVPAAAAAAAAAAPIIDSVSAPDAVASTPAERSTIIIKDGIVSMMPIPDQAPILAMAADSERPAGEQSCLARAVYFEARGESLRGQEAVAQVVLARVKSPGRPKSICGVVYEGSQLSTGCQFSFTCDGIADTIYDDGAWARAQRIASRAMHGKFKQVARGATYYHANYVRPYWASHMIKVATIGTHIFYRP